MQAMPCATELQRLGHRKYRIRHNNMKDERPAYHDYTILSMNTLTNVIKYHHECFG